LAASSISQFGVALNSFFFAQLSKQMTEELQRGVAGVSRSSTDNPNSSLVFCFRR